MTIEPLDSLIDPGIHSNLETKEEMVVLTPDSDRGESLLWRVGKAAGFAFLLMGGGAMATKTDRLVAANPTTSDLTTRLPTPFHQEEFCSAAFFSR